MIIVTSSIREGRNFFSEINSCRDVLVEVLVPASSVVSAVAARAVLANAARHSECGL